MTQDVLRTEWLKYPECIRSQLIARDVFGENVDMATGMVIEPKESGGNRMSHITPLAKREAGAQAIIEKLAEHGWTITTSPLPRSTRAIAIATHKESGQEVKSHAMPEVDAVRFVAWVVMQGSKDG